MRFLTTRTHGVLNYVIGGLLIVAPWLLGFAAGGAETWVPVIIGVLVIVLALFTRYELGAVKRIPMPIHLWVDGLAGAFLAVSPWLLNYAYLVWAPHLLVGLLLLTGALTTHTHPRLLTHGTRRVAPTRPHEPLEPI